MSLLRIYGSLHCDPHPDHQQRCQWVLLDDRLDPVTGEGPLTELPRRADRIQLLIPAAQVLITHARLPHAARRHAGSVLAFAVEEKTACEPDTNHVSWLGAAGDEDVLAVTDKLGIERWHEALGAVGIHIDEIHSETLLLPIRTGEWSIAWNGSEGFVRNGEFEGAATDCGDRESPPLMLRRMLEQAKTHGTIPTSVALYITAPDAAPDIAAWQRELGTELRMAGTWDWRTAPPDAGVSLAQQRRHWRILAGAAKRLRPAAWILGAALTLHAVALITDWTLLANTQRALRQQMETSFRTTFPDAVAVVDPSLQMRRKLATARHGAGLSDSGDFLPMMVQVAAATRELPAGRLRTVSYESGRMTLELTAVEAAAVQRIVVRLIQSGMSVDTAPAGTPGANATVVLTVRAP